MKYQADDFVNPSRECDLIMKGGITSGFVYPFTILELARDHRLVNIGGTSAGAIAAGISAAAEYRRRKDGSGSGFVPVGELADYLKDHLIDLFQPDPQHKKAFQILLDLIRQKKNPLAGFFSALRFINKARTLFKSYKALSSTFLGICSGMTQEGQATPALSDWLNERIETI